MVDNSPSSDDAIDNTTPGNDNPQGVSTPPNDGKVDLTGEPSAAEKNATPDSATASSDPENAYTQPQGQPTQPQAQPGQQQQQQQQQMPKPPGAQSSESAYSTPKDDPSIKRAFRLRDIAMALAGGQRYKTEIDVNTGQEKRTPIHMGRADIGMAIAMEAISGSLAGLAQHGPGAKGRAAAAGYQQVAQESRDAYNRQDAEAQANYARHAQIVETNMRMHQNAMTAGRMNYDASQKQVDANKDLITNLNDKHPGVIKAIVGESHLKDYNVTKDGALPYAVVAALDPKTGKQALNEWGEPQWEMQYAIIDPSFESDDLLSEEDKATLSKYHMPGFVDSDGKPTQLPKDMRLKLGMVTNFKARATSLQLAEQDLKEYYGTVNTDAPGLTTPSISAGPEVEKMVDDAARKYGVPVALARGLAQQESRGNQSLVSPKGAVGIMQLMPGTAKMMNVDEHDAAQNVDGGMRYLSQLMTKYNGDIKLALAAYNAGPGNVTDHVPQNGETEGYVAAISKAIGLDDPAKAGEGKPSDQYAPVDLTEAIAKDKALIPALEKFQSLVNLYKGNYEEAIGHLGQQDQQAAGKILQLYGGREAVEKHDELMTLRRQTIKDNESIRMADVKAANKQAEDDKASEAVQTMLTPPANFEFTPDMYDMSMEDLRKHLEESGVKIPADFASLYKQAHYKLSPAQFANRIWRKGDKIGITRANANSYITQFIKEDYDDTNYDQIRARKVAIGNPNNKDNQAIVNAGTAANHLQMLTLAAEALHNGNITQFNHYANQFGINTGQSAPLVYRALAEKVNQEVEKVAAGGTTPYKDSIENGFANISDDKALQQIRDVAKAYTGLMYGRIKSIDESYNGITGEHVPNVPKSASDLFQSGGMDTPWVKNQAKAAPQTPQSGPPKPGDVREYKGQLVRITKIDPNTGQFDAEPVGRADVFKPVPMR